MRKKSYKRTLEVMRKVVERNETELCTDDEIKKHEMN
jgi:hypothetical protein